MAVPFSILRRIANNFTYLEIGEAIGRRVSVTGIETAPSDVLKVLSDLPFSVINALSDDVAQRNRTYAKYRIFDLTYLIGKNSIGHHNWRLKLEKGGAAIRAAGLVYSHVVGDENRDDQDDEGDKELWDELNEVGVDYLRDLAADVAHNKQEHLYLKLFLKAIPNDKPKNCIEIVRERPRTLIEGLGFPPGYWPRDFTIADACLTNTNMAWISKHFYW